MTIDEHKTSYAGYPIQQWNEGPLKDPSKTAYRIALEHNDAETWLSKFTRFVALPEVAEVEALVVGAWWGSEWRESTEPVVESLVMYHEKLPHLKALFIGDVTYDECEISWINQSDMAPIFLAYPQLEHFGVRGAEGLRFGRLQHENLRSFTLESGGTPVDLVWDLIQADFPQLVDFELWTGDGLYGWDGDLEDLLAFIYGDAFPDLTRLAIRNCELADELAIALSESPIFEQLEVIDFSLGTMGDAGVHYMLNHPLLRPLTPRGQHPLPRTEEPFASQMALKTLDIHHHFCSDEMISDLLELTKYGIHVDASDPQDADDENEDGRYVAVGE